MNRMLTLPVVVALTCAVAGSCAWTPRAGRIRYKNQPVVWRVNDRNDVPEKPKERQYSRVLYHLDGYLVRRTTRAMEVRKSRRAQNVNALGEVPDSSWFENRIGRRSLSVEDIRRGPDTNGNPEQHKPWTITGSKVGGTAIGFLMKDARGQKYLLKFDDPRGPEMETAAHVVVQRLLWACGYHVPEDSIVTFRREDLLLAEDASIKDVFGHKTPMTLEHLNNALEKVDVRPDGSYRGLSSKYLSGIPIGPFAREGVRADDPNDLIPHEDRRELRGAHTIFSWLNHTDLQEDNTLDAWIEDPNTGRHYVAHYLIDFGKALGVMGYLNNWQWIGHFHRVDFAMSLQALLSVGLWKRPHEDVAAPTLRGVGWFESESFDPGKWKSNSIYWPFQDRDRFDAFWGAKILIRFTRAQIEAAVDAGGLSDPRSARYMVDTLVARQRATARHWFQQVAPLDEFEVSSAAGSYELCFHDLGVRHGFVPPAIRSVYGARAFDGSGRETGWEVNGRGGADGRACVAGFGAGEGADGYVIVRLEPRRGYTVLPPVFVHIATDGATDGATAAATGRPRVIGIRRE